MARFRQAKVVASVGAGRIRLAVHFYNLEEELHRVAGLIGRAREQRDYRTALLREDLDFGWALGRGAAFGSHTTLTGVRRLELQGFGSGLVGCR
jgi:hypothetical protein